MEGLRTHDVDVTTAPQVESPLFDELKPPLGDAVVEADRCLECGGVRTRALLVACPADVDVPAFVAAIADGDRARRRRRSSPRTCSAAPARASARRDALRGRLRARPRGPRPIEIGRLQRYATDARLRRACARRRAPANGGASPSSAPARPASPAPASSLRAATTSRSTTSATSPAASSATRSRRTGSRRAAARGGRARRELGVALRARRRIDPARLLASSQGRRRSRPRRRDGRRRRLDLPGDELDGVWESLPFIEALKTGEPPQVGRRVAVIGGGNTAIDVRVEAGGSAPSA